MILLPVTFMTDSGWVVYDIPDRLWLVFCETTDCQILLMLSVKLLTDSNCVVCNIPARFWMCCFWHSWQILVVLCVTLLTDCDYEDFSKRGRLLTNKLIFQGYNVLFVCFFLFIVAWAIFQLSGDCHHYRWRGCKFRPMLSTYDF
jgi:hypothetical protein